MNFSPAWFLSGHAGTRVRSSRDFAFRSPPGAEFAKWLVSSGQCADAQQATQLGQRLIDAQTLFAVDLGANKTVRRGFSDSADAFYRFEASRAHALLVLLGNFAACDFITHSSLTACFISRAMFSAIAISEPMCSPSTR